MNQSVGQSVARELAHRLGAQVLCTQPVAPFTSLKVGGPADYLVRVRSATELARCLVAAAHLALPATVLGGGSNVLISDRGIRGLVLVNQARGYLANEQQGHVILRCESGTPLAGLARTSAARGWRGLEFACGIPGTVGGAVVGNAGAYGGCMAEVVRSVQVWTSRGQEAWAPEGLAFDYRSSRLKRQRDSVVLEVELALAAGDRAAALAQVAGNEESRRARQPSERSVGSVFRNPAGDYAGRLIEAAGLKGTRRGGAEISHVHANFIVNRGGATAADMLALICLARDRVLAASGLRLELEIVPLGDWTPDEIVALSH